MLRRFQTRALAGLLVSISFNTFAAEEKDGAIFVTDTRTAKTADQSLAAVDVITREDIERLQVRNLPELLDGLAGVNVTQSGPFGKQSSVFLRGANSDGVLVLIDGVRFGSATGGVTSFELLPLAEIERIEIVRGPRSSLYGSDAIGGVIQIFTRRDSRDRLTAAAGAGTFSTREGRITASGSSNDLRYTLSASKQATDGINIRPVSVANEPDDDGFDMLGLGFTAEQRFTPSTSISFSAQRSAGRTDFDDPFAFANQIEYVQQIATATLTTQPLDPWTLKLIAGIGRDDQTSLFNGVDAGAINTDRPATTLQNDLSLGKGQLLTLGLDWYEDRVNSDTDYAETERYNRAVFAQHQANFGAWDLLASLRHDQNEAFGGHNTGNIAAGVQTGPVRLLASYGTAFKAPSFNNLYFPFFGNPNLEPEESETFDIGAQTRMGRHAFDLHWFQTNADNLIVFTGIGPENVGEARIRGIEFETRVNAAPWVGNVALTYLDPRDLVTGEILPRRARASGRINVDRSFGRHSAGLSIIGSGKRQAGAFDSHDTASYGILNLRAQAALGKGFLLRARVDNVFDKEYETVPDYNSAGRAGFLELAWEQPN